MCLPYYDDLVDKNRDDITFVNVLDMYDVFYRIIDKKYSENCADLIVLFANK